MEYIELTDKEVNEFRRLLSLGFEVMVRTIYKSGYDQAEKDYEKLFLEALKSNKK